MRSEELGCCGRKMKGDEWKCLCCGLGGGDGGVVEWWSGGVGEWWM